MRSAARNLILRYHHLTHTDRRASFVRCLYAHSIFPETRPAFEQLLRDLRNQADFISTRDLIEMIGSDSPVRGRYYHLSFDDGFANVFEEGGAFLADQAIPYTIFLTTGMIGASLREIDAVYRAMLELEHPVRALSWDQVRACVAAGGEMGCHSRSHVRLSEISFSPRLLHAETVQAKADIERETGQPCLAFSWPFGNARAIDQVSKAAIRAAGFEICFSGERGRIEAGRTDRWHVPRHHIEFHNPMWENRLWAAGLHEDGALISRLLKGHR